MTEKVMEGVKGGWVYMLSDHPNGVIYIGVTSDLVRRVWQHKQNQVSGFSAKYHAHRLVWFESHESIIEAITREKQLKNWNRKWKIELIKQENPQWRDLYNEIT